MGTYLYSLRSPRLARIVDVVGKDGTIITMEAASMSYLYKPSWSGRFDGKGSRYARFERAMDMVIANVERLWTKSGRTIPQAAVITDCDKRHVIEVGNTVKAWPKRGSAPSSVHDDPDYGGAIHLGKVAAVRPIPA